MLTRVRGHGEGPVRICLFMQVSGLTRPTLLWLPRLDSNENQTPLKQ